jgi:predicted amidohydrolase
LALQSADIVCLPTNWPESAQPSSDIICPARCIENNIYVAAANRVGEERGFNFIGRSKIIAPGGKILAALDNTDEAVAIAEVDVEKARTKRVVRIPGEYELELWTSRRPELYGPLTQQ